MLASTLGRYGIAANDLDAFQRVRELLTPWSISDRANLYGSFFSPGYLFVTGGNQLSESTRTAGVLTGPTPTSWRSSEQAATRKMVQVMSAALLTWGALIGKPPL